MYTLFSSFPFHVCQTFISPLFQGAPETIQEMLIDLPPSYVQTYKKYTRQGSRVLALAYKFLPEMTVRVVLFCDNLFWIFPPLTFLIFPCYYWLFLYGVYIVNIRVSYCASK